MKVSETILDGWKELRERGDNEKIAKILNVEKQTVANWISTGDMPLKSLKEISKFYKKKRVAVQKIEDDNN